MRAVSLVVLLVLFAGCSGSAPMTPSPTAQTTHTPVESATPTETATASPTTTPTASPTPRPPQNPWEADPVTVAIQDRTESERDWRPLVREGLSFWEENAENHTRFSVNYKLIESTSAANIVIRILPAVTECNYETPETTLGCAPVYYRVGEAPLQSTVDIEAGYDDASTVNTIKHELGHTLGLDHDYADTLAFMNATANVTEVLQPNATEKPYSWQNSTLRVYVDYSNISEYDLPYYEDEVQKAIRYYEGGADGNVPKNVSFRMVGAREEADIVIEFPREIDGDREVSLADRWGSDPDDDGALEFYTEYRISVATGIERENVGYHVGYWLAFALGSSSQSEHPPPFDGVGDDRDDW